MSEPLESLIIYLAIIILTILLMYLGMKLGEYVAKKRGEKSINFKSELDKIVKEWKKKHGLD
ncbi:MAG: hypothetical protein ACP6IP_02330 [Candidatus Njordarchaeia archaeon]